MPAIKKAQARGVMVIALDSPTEPMDATDALFATDNYKAGELIGQYAKAASAGKKPVIATLDLFPGHPVGAQRHNGFLKGFGLQANDAKSNELSRPPKGGLHGRQLWRPRQGQTGMENCLQKNPTSTSSTPSTGRRRRCLQRAQGRRQEKNVLIVSVDGGCAGIADVGKGVIAATSQRYPLRMAAMGVAAAWNTPRPARRSAATPTPA